MSGAASYTEILLILEFDINDLDNGRTNTQLLNDLATIRDAFKAAALAVNPTVIFKSACLTMPAGYDPAVNPPNYINSSWDLDIQQPWNAYLRANYAAHGFDKVIDIAANPLLGAAGAEKSSTYFYTDHVHPIDPGHAEMGAIVAADASDLLTITPPLNGFLQVGFAGGFIG
jgi:hypothetical protein